MTDPNLILPETRTSSVMFTSKVLWLILEICLQSPCLVRIRSRLVVQGFCGCDVNRCAAFLSENVRRPACSL